MADGDSTRTEDGAIPESAMMGTGVMRLVARLLGAGNPRPDQAQLRRVREFAQVGDPLADDVVAMMGELPAGAGRRMFERALLEGIDAVTDAPAPLRAFFGSVEATPYWLDRAQLEAGARAITRVGLLGLFPLGDIALMGGYLASRTAKTLVGTGEIEQMANQRLVETALWWIDLTTPGALRRHGPGYAAALRVRLVHAHVRAAMNRRPDWDYQAWDQPVNQAQTAGTLLLFSHIFVVGTRLLGVRYTAEERAAILHLWRYVGWLLGVDDELLPATENDCWRLLWLLDITEFRPDQDSRRLAAALMATHQAFGERFGPLSGPVGRAWGSVHGSISRLVLGRDNADFLGLPDDPVTRALLVGAAAVNFTGETARRWMPGATALQRRQGSWARQWYVDELTRHFPLDRQHGSRVLQVHREAG